MLNLPDHAQPLSLAGSTVDFFSFTKDDVLYYYFDTSLTAAPEPMVNAMRGLSLLKNPQEKLIMINHQKPMGLIAKLQENFTIDVTKRDDDNYQILFSFKEGLSQNSDFTDTHCGG